MLSHAPGGGTCALNTHVSSGLQLACLLLPTHRPPPIARLDFRKVGCDAATRVSNASSHLAVIASSVVLDSELSAWPPLHHSLRADIEPPLFGLRLI